MFLICIGLCVCEEPVVQNTSPIDLEKEILDISRVAGKDILGKDLDVGRYEGEIDRITVECAKRIEGKKNGREIVEAVNVYLFGELGIQPDPKEQDVDGIFIDAVLDAKKGPCLALSGLYLIIGQKLNLPLHGVLVPGHFFVRYDDGKTVMNIETLKKGALMKEHWYREKYRIPDGNSCYFRNLTAKESLAPFLFNLGNAYRTAGKLDNAVAAYEQAAAILPDFAEVHGNLGVAYFKKGEMDKAVSEFHAAVRANPLVPGAYLDLGAAYHAQRKYDDAIASYKEGLNIVPHSPELLNALGMAYQAQGRLNEAVANYKHAVAAKPDFAEAYRNLASALKALGEDSLAEKYLKKAGGLATNASK
jgi:tetratricopeptide (TPR) repeat protein